MEAVWRLMCRTHDVYYHDQSELWRRCAYRREGSKSHYVNPTLKGVNLGRLYRHGDHQHVSRPDSSLRLCNASPCPKADDEPINDRQFRRRISDVSALISTTSLISFLSAINLSWSTPLLQRPVYLLVPIISHKLSNGWNPVSAIWTISRNDR
jgi:hypothetical protein